MTQAFLRGGGEMGGRIRAHDWASSPIGAPETWPGNLLTALAICLSSRLPMQVWWGQDLTLFYNDGCIGLFGLKDGAMVGRTARDVCGERWPRVEPVARRVLETGEPAVCDELALSAIAGADGHADGIVCTCPSAGLDVMIRVHMLSMRLLHAPDASAAIQEALDTMIRLQAADAGEARIHGHGTRAPRVVQRGSAQAQWMVRVSPLIDSRGRTIASLSLAFRDTRALAERERRDAELFLSVAAAFLECKLQEEALRDADLRRDELLASIAHELRNPMVPLAAAVESARARYPGDSWLMHMADMMDRQLTRVTRLVDELTDMGRIKSGKVRLRRARVPLARVVDASLEQCRPAIEANHHELVVEQCDEPLVVDVDAYRMSQVITNLLQNASKYTPKGGHIVISTWREHDVAAVSVADSGIGIAASDLPHVFDLFWQGTSHTAHARGGLGIGLAIVHSLVELHGGTIAAESGGPGKGSRFTVRLPLSAATAASLTVRDRLAGLRVLIADDNVDAADALASLLRAEGFEVAIAHDGIEALDRAADVRPDAALLDLGMPRMDGFEAARRLRESHGSRMSIVALTGWGEEKDRERTHAAGFDGHLVKPVTMESLKELLGTLRSNAMTRSNAA